jgi:drug/metabolite transporter (DMT)-like permease
MLLFNSVEPIIRRKQHALDFQDRQGLLKLRLQISNKTLFHNIYTRIDQVFVVWGLITAVIFLTAQFAPIDWVTQATFWSILTVVGTASMTVLTHFWVKVERLRWILYAWIVLMLGGVVITNCGIYYGSVTVLIHLCHLWLALSAVGYFCTGIGLRSRAFIMSGLFHILGIAILPFCMGWEFLTTGLVMTANLLMFAETQWDMRLPIDNYSILTEEQKEFNREQSLIRQAESV